MLKRIAFMFLNFGVKRVTGKRKSVMFSAQANSRCYKKHLVGEDQTVCVDKVPNQTELR